MGCTGSKDNNKKTLNRLSQYHLAALQEAQGLVCLPVPLEDEENTTGDAIITLRSFHNLFYDGFYAPYVRNPDYLLLIDMRMDERQYLHERILTAKWHANVKELREVPSSGEKDPLHKYCHIVLYDVDGASISKPDSELRKLCRELRERKLEPYCLAGGLRAVRERCPYLLSRPGSQRSSSFENGFSTLSWFPSIILDGQLFLGRCDQAANPEVLSNLGVSHVVSTSGDGSRNHKNRKTKDTRILLLAPPADENKKTSKHQSKSSSSKSPSCLSKGSTDTLDDPTVTTKLLTDEMPKLTEFVKEAFETGGRVLVQGELGVDRSAALVMALLMQQRLCSLEDAYYYVKRCRPTVQPSDNFLKALAKFEVEIFGKRLTSIEDLCY